MQSGCCGGIRRDSVWTFHACGRHCGNSRVCRNKQNSVGFGLAAAERSADRYNGFAAPVQPMVQLLSLPLLFTLWLLFSGIGRFVSAFDLRALGVRAWGWVLAIGILLTAAGIICMMNPWISVAAVGLTVGLVLILQGISLVVCACISSGKEA